jgi:hypothetical protein
LKLRIRFKNKLIGILCERGAKMKVEKEGGKTG